MDFDGFHATQVEESDNHALFFECKRRHFTIRNYWDSTSQAFNGVEQCCHLASPNLKDSHVFSNTFHVAKFIVQREGKENNKYFIFFQTIHAGNAASGP